jgi:hypothetical protein
MKLLTSAFLAGFAAGLAPAALAETAKTESAAPQDDTESRIVAIMQERGARADQIDNTLKWWRRLEPEFQNRILAAAPEAAWAMIICDFQGFGPRNVGAERAAKCEADVQEDIDRGRTQWGADGKFQGASQDCKARNKRDEWGRLICG